MGKLHLDRRGALASMLAGAALVATLALAPCGDACGPEVAEQSDAAIGGIETTGAASSAPTKAMDPIATNPLEEEPLWAVYSRSTDIDTIAEACDQVTTREIHRQAKPRAWVAPILQWCLHRAYHSSRFGRVVSRVDGSQIHDRDRPTASVIYAIARSYMDPACEEMRVSGHEKHPPECQSMQREWPFSDVRLADVTRATWRERSHAYERFGARGPIDNNATAYRWLPGCYAPELLDRNDIAALVTVRHAIAICDGLLVPCTKAAIKARW